MVPASGGRAGARAAGRHANPTATIPDASGPRTVALSDLMAKIVRVNLFRRHPIALGLIALVLVSALAPLPALVDAASGAPPPDADLIRPALYTLFAPASDVLDALTFLSLERARAFLLVWVSGIALWGVTRPGSVTRRLLRAGATGLAFALLVVAVLVLPRPVPRLVTADSTLTVIDYHAHTARSHDGRPGWTVADLARWHAAQGFQASYVTDHNVILDRAVDDPIRLLPGVEWSVYGQHIVAHGARPGVAAGRGPRFARGGRERQSRLGQGDLRLEPLRAERPRLPRQPRHRAVGRARSSGLGTVDGGLHPALAHVRGALVERAVELAHLDPRDPDLSRRAAP